MEKIEKTDKTKKKQNLSRKKIINSAMVLFANKGFDSTSTREICKHAGVNLSLISYYFENKDNLYTNIIESILNYGLDFIQEDLNKTKELNKLNHNEKVELYCNILSKYIDFLYSDSVPSSFVILMLKEQTVSHSKFRETFMKKIEPLYSGLRKTLASILNKNEKDKTITLEVFSLIGQILSFRLMEKSTLKFLGQYKYTNTDNKKIREIVYGYVQRSLDGLGIKQQ